MRLVAIDSETTVIRTARKVHTCVACEQEAIQPGDQYAEDVAMAEGPYASGWRYCGPCAFTEGLAVQGEENP